MKNSFAAQPPGEVLLGYELTSSISADQRSP
jgi:hypothetical protein